MDSKPATATNIRLGISSCLLGVPTRYDGGHTRDDFLIDELGRFVEWVPVCPEAEAGLGVPREPIRLTGDPEEPRVLTIGTRIDRTAVLASWAERRVGELEVEDLSGFVFKRDSPSCGPSRVKVHTGSGSLLRQGVGLFARAFVERFPTLPVEDEQRLRDPQLRENFVERIFALKRWREQVSPAAGVGEVAAFHRRHKLQLLSHSPEHYRSMGRLVAEAKGVEHGKVRSTYEHLLVQALGRHATRAKHVNVLHHAAGYFKRELSPDEKQELSETFEAYRLGSLPLIVPITLLAHHVRHLEEPYLAQQYYLHPHPVEINLRYHV